MIANTLFLIVSGYLFSKIFPNKKHEINTITEGLSSIINLQLVEPKYGQSGYLSGIAVNQSIKELYEKYTGKSTNLTDYYDYWIEFFKNYAPIEKQESEEHMESQEAKIQPNITKEAKLQSDSFKASDTILYKFFLQNMRKKNSLLQ